MLARSAGGSMKMRNERYWNNFIKIDGFIEYGKKLIFIVIKFILSQKMPFIYKGFSVSQTPKLYQRWQENQRLTVLGQAGVYKKK